MGEAGLDTVRLEKNLGRKPGGSALCSSLGRRVGRDVQGKDGAADGRELARHAFR